mmetsp:Transcript_11164/g.15720  ORF Transcript_11164/g.15720 Transcript_11164/m.15720 type:complete len:276 (+) Transcript_11164:112-939(+)|eukprot:CAMPEP_0184861388 /NCGR_PEP_ID=MMETSP0580-20130426/6088_1 /TAXON_ID=1118495 /ORGANISM="Dactyliosolen fragilissimus" /LENGTH=275 /DNA_ID=CAMNT_0027358869 /DNA_START=98 /DNA_END=925 /DNA_ORIENTATION=-
MSITQTLLSHDTSLRQYVSKLARSNNIAKCFIGTSSIPTNQSVASHSSYETSYGSSSHFMLILGKPGGGKGTISKKILKDFPKFEHLSTGDVLRQHVRNQTTIGKEAKRHMDAGGLVPNEVMVQLVLEDADKIISSGKSLLLDGFPRTMEQAKTLNDYIDVDLVVELDIPTETIVDRIADRWIHPSSGKVYNYSYNPPRVHGKDDETGEDLVQRDDDKPETVRKRLRAYDEVTAPLVEYYDEKGVIRTFKGTMSDVIYPEVKLWLQEELKETNSI